MAEHAHASANTAHHESHHADDTHEGSHVVPLKVYYMVFAALMALLVLTLGAAAIDFAKISPSLAPLNIIIAMTIAIVKAALVILYFMHVRYSSRIIWLFAGAGFFWLIILFTFILSDYFSRHMLPNPTSWTVQ